MNKQSILLTFGVLTFFTTSIITHTVDLPVEDKNFNNNEVYSITYALNILQNDSSSADGQERKFGFPSPASEELFKQIRAQYLDLKNESPEDASAYLGQVLVELNKLTN